MTRIHLSLLLAATLALLCGCATTPYKDIPAARLTDEQLVDELAAAAQGVGRQINRADFLMATKPDPFYVLSSATTNYSGITNVSGSGYYVPSARAYSFQGVGATMGVAQTRYFYTDVNAYARLIHDLAAVIASARAEAYRVRGQEVLAEIRRRTEAPRATVQSSVDAWFARQTGEQIDKALVTAVLAWIPSSANASPTEQLDKAKGAIDAMQRGPGASGDWYGVFAQTSTLKDGRKFVLNNFVRTTLSQSGDKLVGVADLGTGERVEIEGTIAGEVVAGTMNNRGANLLLSGSGRVEPKRMTLDFRGESNRLSVEGKVVLYR